MTDVDGGDPSRQRRFQLPRAPTAAARAREEARQAMVAWGCGRIDDVVLACSELVTNAVVHTGSDPTVVIGCSAGLMRVEVHDADHTAPVVKAPDAPVGGFGLRIVGELSDDWGSYPTPTGKVVWATFACAH